MVPETMCPTWPYDRMAGGDTLICGSVTEIDNLHEFLDMENERRWNEDFHAARIANLFHITMFKWQTKPKPAGDPTLLHARWLLIVVSDTWSKNLSYRHRILSVRETSRNSPCAFFTDSN